MAAVSGLIRIDFDTESGALGQGVRHSFDSDAALLSLLVRRLDLGGDVGWTISRGKGCDAQGECQEGDGEAHDCKWIGIDVGEVVPKS